MMKTHNDLSFVSAVSSSESKRLFSVRRDRILPAASRTIFPSSRRTLADVSLSAQSSAMNRSFSACRWPDTRFKSVSSLLRILDAASLSSCSCLRKSFSTARNIARSSKKLRQCRYRQRESRATRNGLY